MGTLHLVFTAPTAGSALGDCLRAAAAGDSVLLLQDGVHAVLRPPRLPAGVALQVLQADTEARGLTALVPAAMTVVDDAGFVALSERHARVVSWF